MAQISAVQFNGSNAYELLVGEFVSSWPIGAVGFTDIAVGVQVYTATVSAGVKLTLRSFNAAGAVLSAQDFTYLVTNTSMWERAETTWTCPTGIDRAELRITAVGGTVLFAQPKLERGTEVGEYSTNYAPQLTLLTPTGIYTGTLTANQVIVSGNEDLASRLTVIGAGMATFVKYDDINQPSSTVIDGGNITTGTLKSADNSTWINLSNGSFSFSNGNFTYNSVDGAQIGGWEINDDALTKTITYSLGPFVQADHVALTNHVNQLSIITDPVILNKYDLNRDGILDTFDMIQMQYCLGGTWPNPVPFSDAVTLSLSSTDGIIKATTTNLFTNTVIAQNAMYPGYSKSDNVVANDVYSKYVTAQTYKWDDPDSNSTGFGQSGSFIDGRGHAVTIKGGIVTSILSSFTNIELKDASGQNRVYADGTETTLISPNGSTYVRVANGRVSVVVSGVEKFAWT